MVDFPVDYSRKFSSLIGVMSRTPFFAGLKIQVRVINALMMREAMTKFGRENIGFFWLMGEPMILTVGVMIMWSMAGLTHGHGIDVVPFALSGYTLLTFWRHITGSSVHCFRSSAGLLFHRNVHFIDVLISRTLLESAGIGSAFFVAYVPLFLLGYLDPLFDPLLLVCAWLLLMWFSFGVALIIASLSEMSELVEHFVPPIMYIMLPISGAFFMVDWLPQKYRDIVLYSPQTNINEMFRSGMFGDKIKTYWDVPYTVAWCIAVTAVGYFLASHARRRIRFQ